MAVCLLAVMMARLSPPCLPAPMSDSYPKHTLLAKVIRVDKEHGRTHVTLAVVPLQTQVVFEGVSEKLRVGDFVEFNITHNEAKLGGKKMRVAQIIWITE